MATTRENIRGEQTDNLYIESSTQSSPTYSQLSLNDLKKEIVDTCCGRSRPKPERPHDLQFCFNDLLADLRAQLAVKVNEEKSLLKGLNESLHSSPVAAGHKCSSDLSRSFNLAVTRLSNQMTLVESDVKQLASSLNMISGLADNISGKVSALDIAKGRVIDCMQCVCDLIDLGTCAEGVRTAMEQEDYEQAARHVHKFLTLDAAVFQCGDPADSKDSGQPTGRSYEILRTTASELKMIIERKFDAAVEMNDVASIQRFFKLFPLLNEHANGITRFADYVCKEIRKMADKNYKVMLAGGSDDRRSSVLYADSLTMLFEGIAREIQVYEPLIDSSYGPDKLLSLIEILQKECDKEADRIIEAFIKNRQYEKKARLVEKMMRNADKNSCSEKINVLDLDVILSEVTLMHTRTNLYWRYLRRRLNAANVKTDEHVKSESDVEDISEEERQKLEESLVEKKRGRDRKLDDLLLRSALGTKMQELSDKYVLMEQYYMKESVAKAISMDSKEPDNRTSSAPDDVFFIIMKCLRRSLSSSSVECICALLNIAVTTLETDYFRYIYSGIKAGFPSVGWTAEAYQTAQTAYNVIQHGKTVADAGPEKQKEVFLTSLSNIRTSVDCTKTLKEGLLSDFRKHLSELSDLEKSKLDNAFAQFDDVMRKFENSANIGVDKLCVAAFKPKLRALAEAYLDITHTPTETEFADFEADDPFMENFISSLNTHLITFEPLLTSQNYKELMASVCAEVSQQIERVISKSVYNRLGGLQLDKDFRALTSYLTGIVGWVVREKCTRISQIVSIINVDSVAEAVECFQQLQSHTRMLTSEEAKKYLALRIDLPAECIKNAVF